MRGNIKNDTTEGISNILVKYVLIYVVLTCVDYFLLNYALGEKESKTMLWGLISLSVVYQIYTSLELLVISKMRSSSKMIASLYLAFKTGRLVLSLLFLVLYGILHGQHMIAFTLIVGSFYLLTLMLLSLHFIKLEQKK